MRFRPIVIFPSRKRTARERPATHRPACTTWIEAAELARRIRPLLNQRQSRLVADLPEAALPAWIDPVLVDSAITNLLVNALRHGPGGGTATLGVFRDGGTQLVIDVTDDGPGIAPERRQHVFERFYRARGEQSPGSYGLGLWLVRDALKGDWRVVEAADARAALDALALRLSDVIVSDIMMPSVDGIELLATLRAVVDRLLARQKRLQTRAQSESTAPVEPDRPSWAPDELTEPQRILVNRFQIAVEARLADEDMAVDDLAAALGQSRATLYRKLKQATDRSPSELIREIRLLQAHKLLEQGDGSVSEVGYAVGFRSVASFSNAFFACYGKRPSKILK